MIIFPGTCKTTFSATTAPSTSSTTTLYTKMKKLLKLLASSRATVTKRRHHHGAGAARHVGIAVVNNEDHSDDDEDEGTAYDSKTSYTSPTTNTTPEDDTEVEDDEIVEEQESNKSSFPQHQPATKLDTNSKVHEDDDNKVHSGLVVNHKEETSPKVHVVVAAATTTLTAATVLASSPASASVPVNSHNATHATQSSGKHHHHNMINMDILYEDHEHQANDDDDGNDDDNDKDTAKDDDSTTALADQRSRTSSSSPCTSLSKKSKRGQGRRPSQRQLRREQPPPPPTQPPPCFLTNNLHHVTSRTASSSLAASVFDQAQPATDTKTTLVRLPRFWAARLALQTLSSSSSCHPSRLENHHLVNSPDPDEEEVRKRSAFLLMCFVMNALVILRACMYNHIFGYNHSYNTVLLFPVAHVLLVGVNVTLLIISLTARQHCYDYHAFVQNQLLLLTIVPLLEHVYLGGWQASGAVVLWSFLAPLLAAFCQSRRAAQVWFQYLLVCIVPCMMYEIVAVVVLQPTATISTSSTTTMTTTATTLLLSIMNVLGTMSIWFAAALFWSSSIENSQSRLQDVLQQFLPSHVATCMQQQQQQGQHGVSIPSLLHQYDQVSLLSIRVVRGGGGGGGGSGGGSGHIGGCDKEADCLLTDFLQEFFHGIDQRMQQHQRPSPLTKVKSMGNLCLIAGGIEEEQEDGNDDEQQQDQHGRSNVDDWSTASTTATWTTTGTAVAENHPAAQLLRLAAELFPFSDDVNRRLGTNFDIRMGLHVGPVVAGVLMNNTPEQQHQQQSSHRRRHHQPLLSYDVWGHAVDVVHDLQLQSLSAYGGLVHLSQEAYDKVRHLQDLYLFAANSGSSSSNSQPAANIARTYFCKSKLLVASSTSICSSSNASKEYR